MIQSSKFEVVKFDPNFSGNAHNLRVSYWNNQLWYCTKDVINIFNLNKDIKTIQDELIEIFGEECLNMQFNLPVVSESAFNYLIMISNTKLGNKIVRHVCNDLIKIGREYHREQQEKKIVERELAKIEKEIT